MFELPSTAERRGLVDAERRQFITDREEPKQFLMSFKLLR